MQRVSLIKSIPQSCAGLDYYTNTAFEFVSNDLGAQSTVCGGGRYNGLVEQLGGGNIPGIGFGMGIERLILLLQEQNLIPETETKNRSLHCSVGIEAQKIAFDLTTKLRNAGVNVQTDMMERSLKAQMKFADKINAQYVLIIGEDELKKNAAILRNMQTKEQESIPLDGVLAKFTK
jgi:histidyl-tRNA synthetase